MEEEEVSTYENELSDNLNNNEMQVDPATSTVKNRRYNRYVFPTFN